MRKTFIYHDGALGDLLLSLPCIAALREDTDLLHIACRTDIQALLTESHSADAASSSGSSLFASLYSDRAEARTADFLAQFDRALVFTKGDSALVPAIGRIVPHTDAILTIPPEGSGQHAAQYRVNQVVPAGTPSTSLRLEVPLPHREKARNLLVEKAGFPTGTHLVALHPGSGGKSKCWPLENYLALAERLAGRGDLFLLLFSGPSEDEGTKGLLDAFAGRHDRALHVMDRDLVTVAALLSISGTFVGNDSGISHLAATVGVGVVTLFGPTDPLVWRPFGDNVRTLTAGPPGSPVAGIRVNDVYGAVARLLP